MQSNTSRELPLEENPFRSNYQAPQRCPKCQSFFLTEDECESCGLQLKFKPLGDLFGEKSFYTIREFYWSQLSSIEKIDRSLENRKSEKAKRYISKVLMRYNDLLEFFYNESGETSSDRAILFNELKDIVLELIKYEVPEKDIWKKVKSYDEKEKDFDLSFYQRIDLAIREGKKRKENEVNLFKRLISYRVFGVMKISTVFFLSVLLGITIHFSLSYYGYLIKMSAY